MAQIVEAEAFHAAALKQPVKPLGDLIGREGADTPTALAAQLLDQLGRQRREAIPG